MLDEDIKMFWFLRYERLRKQWLTEPYTRKLAEDYVQAQTQYYHYRRKCADALTVRSKPMCDHRLAYHSEHGTNMIVYCTRCNAQWEALTQSRNPC